MYGNYFKAKFMSVIIILIGSLLFLNDLVRSFSFSWWGVILILIGAGLFNVMKVTAVEINAIRQELFEIRKLTQENSKDRKQELL